MLIQLTINDLDVIIDEVNASDEKKENGQEAEREEKEGG